MTTSTSSSTNRGGSSGEGSGPGGYSSNSGASWNSSESSSTNPTKTALITPHKLMGLQPGFMVLTLDGLSDMIPVYAPPYYDIEQCWRRARANPYYLA
jgi:hypothetical protein